MKIKKQKLLIEFKDFISKGNAMQMAVAFIMGGAFTAIVMSLVNDIFMPFIALVGGKDISSWKVMLKENFVTNPDNTIKDMSIYLNYGKFIQAVINFLIISLILFVVIKIVFMIKNASKKALEKIKPNNDIIITKDQSVEKKPTTEEILLEIRDILNQNKENIDRQN